MYSNRKCQNKCTHRVTRIVDFDALSIISLLIYYIYYFKLLNITPLYKSVCVCIANYANKSHIWQKSHLEQTLDH